MENEYEVKLKNVDSIRNSVACQIKDMEERLTQLKRQYDIETGRMVEIQISFQKRRQEIEEIEKLKKQEEKKSLT